jgi:hypothetical protein
MCMMKKWSVLHVSPLHLLKPLRDIFFNPHSTTTHHKSTLTSHRSEPIYSNQWSREPLQHCLWWYTPIPWIWTSALGMGCGTNAVRGTTVLQLQNRPAAMCHQDLLHYTLPHHPNTLEGQAAYLVQVKV